MRIKHYNHIKSMDKKKEALHRALGSNTPVNASGTLSPFSDEIASLYSEEEIQEDKPKDDSFIDVDMLNNELLNPDEEKKEAIDALENPADTIRRMKAEKEAIQKRLEENALHMTNERVAELEEKFENIINKLKSDSLILLNSLDMGAFKKEISYYMVEFAEKDMGFRTKVHDLFDEIGKHRDVNTKKEVKKAKGAKKAKKTRSKILDILMISVGALVMISATLYYLTGGKIIKSKREIVAVVEKEIQPNVKAKEIKEKVSKPVQTDEIVTVSPKKEVNFLIETKARFSIRCTNGYRKKFLRKKKLKGYIEDGRFYFKTKQDSTELYCSIDELSIEKIF